MFALCNSTQQFSHGEDNMVRFPKAVTAFALRQIAIEKIVKQKCNCYWHTIGEPDMCLSARQVTFEDLSLLGDFPDDYPDFDPLDDEGNYPCLCYYCRTGQSELCVEDGDDYRMFDLVGDFVPDGAVAFDDLPVPPVRVSKFHRVNRIAELEHHGLIVVGLGRLDREERSRKHEERKLRFMIPRRNRERLAQILAREEAAACTYTLQDELRSLEALYPEDATRITARERMELLQRNFPALSASSVRCIASSLHIQNSSSFKGLGGLQTLEAHVAKRNEEYFLELDCYLPDEDSLSNAHALLDSFNRVALLAFHG
ncbi:MAG TPA: hypothetical protein VJ579_03230 [Candidatus Paceibacterota bacterium]|nr:hypothetical protein [Candidatus Paceibacterota bacterium]